jgi:hypothetical protein
VIFYALQKRNYTTAIMLATALIIALAVEDIAAH